MTSSRTPTDLLGVEPATADGLPGAPGTLPSFGGMLSVEGLPGQLASSLQPAVRPAYSLAASANRRTAGGEELRRIMLEVLRVTGRALVPASSPQSRWVKEGVVDWQQISCVLLNDEAGADPQKCRSKDCDGFDCDGGMTCRSEFSCQAASCTGTNTCSDTQGCGGTLSCVGTNTCSAEGCIDEACVGVQVCTDALQCGYPGTSGHACVGVQAPCLGIYDDFCNEHCDEQCPLEGVAGCLVDIQDPTCLDEGGPGVGVTRSPALQWLDVARELDPHVGMAEVDDG